MKTGGCACGQVRYECRDAEPIAVERLAQALASGALRVWCVAPTWPQIGCMDGPSHRVVETRQALVLSSIEATIRIANNPTS